MAASGKLVGRKKRCPLLTLSDGGVAGEGRGEIVREMAQILPERPSEGTLQFLLLL